ncbi:MAG: hypothetical protein PHO32_09855 [Candidatus Cloacimonetes bacterium]|nr:hypothetical protein [Candidatus Cloacimonadota bacterium]
MKIKPVSIAKVLCGDYNGIQVFMAPVTLFYWIESSSILSSVTSLLSLRIHYFPLLAFLIVLAFTAFMIVKLSLLHQGTSEELTDTIIDLNISVLALLLIALIIYAISSFLSYFYGIKGTIKTMMYLLFKLYTSLIIMHYYIMHVWLKPFYDRNYGSKRAVKALKSWIRYHKMQLFRYTVLLLAIVFSSARLFQLMLVYIVFPLLTMLSSLLGTGFRFRLVPFYHSSDIAVNVLILIAVFVLSNLCFYPIITALSYLSNLLHPIKLRIIPDNHKRDN